MAGAVVCPGCGRKVPVELPRCPSCGGALDAAGMSLADATGDPELAKLRREQTGFRWRWVMVSLAIFAIDVLIVYGLAAYGGDRRITAG